MRRMRTTTRTIWLIASFGRYVTASAAKGKWAMRVVLPDPSMKKEKEVSFCPAQEWDDKQVSTFPTLLTAEFSLARTLSVCLCCCVVISEAG